MTDAAPLAEFPPGVALVVGGSGGVGSAIARRLARSGAAVALTYRHGRDAAERVVAEIRAMGVHAEAHALALDAAETVAPLVDTIAARHGRLHTVVHAAGSDIAMRRIAEVELDEWRRVIDADLDGFFAVVRASLPHLREGGGSLVAVTSAGLRRFPTRDILSVAPKAAIEALVLGVAREEGRFGVRANAVALGVIDTGIFLRLRDHGLSAGWREAALRNIALRRFGTAEEVAEAAVFLASSRAAYVTGQTLALDGGYSV